MLRSEVSSGKKTLIYYKINNPLCEAEYVTLAAIVRALNPIQLGAEKLCSRDVTLFSAERVFCFIIEERHEQNCLFIGIERSIDI